MPILPEERSERTERMLMVRVLTRRDWDLLQGWHRHYSGSTVEHLWAGLFVLTIPPSEAGEEAA